jgi:hypothetical protein
MRESFPDQLGGGCEKIGCWLAEIYNRAVVSRLTAEILVRPVVKVVGACYFLHNIRSAARLRTIRRIIRPRLLSAPYTIIDAVAH